MIDMFSLKSILFQVLHTIGLVRTCTGSTPSSTALKCPKSTAAIAWFSSTKTSLNLAASHWTPAKGQGSFSGLIGVKTHVSSVLAWTVRTVKLSLQLRFTGLTAWLWIFLRNGCISPTQSWITLISATMTALADSKCWQTVIICYIPTLCLCLKTRSIGQIDS